MDPKPTRIISDIKPPVRQARPTTPKPMQTEAVPIRTPAPGKPAPTQPVSAEPVATQTTAGPKRRWLAVVVIVLTILVLGAAAGGWYWFYIRT